MLADGDDVSSIPAPCCSVVHKGLAAKLRPHQVEGVKFLFDACMGRRGVGRGCILADDMGLGKTLMTLTTIYTFLKQGPRGKPEAGNAAVICPTSLVHNWAAEVHKWLGGDLPKVRGGPTHQQHAAHQAR